MRLELRLVISVLLSVAVAQTPVPGRPTGKRGSRAFPLLSCALYCLLPAGYIYQSPSSPKIVVEAFYDL